MARKLPGMRRARPTRNPVVCHGVRLALQVSSKHIEAFRFLHGKELRMRFHAHRFLGKPHRAAKSQPQNVHERDNPPKVSRSAPRPLTAVAIANMRPGAVLADGAIRPGFGSLKVRKRKTTGGCRIVAAARRARSVLTTYPRHGVMRGSHRLTFAR